MSAAPEPIAALREANEATRGSAVKLAAEVSSRLLGLATTLLLIRGLGPADFGAFSGLQLYAILFAELGEIGLQNLASRALVARSISLRAMVRARLALAVLLAVLAPLVLGLVPRVQPPGTQRSWLLLLIAWFVSSGWAEFLGVALRCRSQRLREALLLVVLRAGALGAAAVAVGLGEGLDGTALGLALSPLPALLLGAWWLWPKATPPEDASAPEPAVSKVLRESAPLGVHSALLLLSPRVEFLVMLWLAAGSVADPAGDARRGMFAVALNVIWFLSMVPSAIAAGAMPGLTRESLRGEAAVRRRTAATLALLAAPAAVGLLLLATPVVGLLTGARQVAEGAVPLRIMALALPAQFLNALAAAALIAAGRGAWLPWLTAGRVLLAFGLASALVPPFGGVGAAAGYVVSEWALLALASQACRRARAALPLASPLVISLGACVPMALAVSGVRDDLPLAVGVGVVTWAATLAAAWRLVPRILQRLFDHVRYP